MTEVQQDLEDMRMAATAKALGHPARLRILRLLARTPGCIGGDIVEAVGLAQSTVSKHLACLRDCGLVQSQPQGRASVFSLTLGVPVRDVLAAAERVLVATGEAVTDCPTAGGHR